MRARTWYHHLPRHAFVPVELVHGWLTLLYNTSGNNPGIVKVHFPQSCQLGGLCLGQSHTKCIDTSVHYAKSYVRSFLLLVVMHLLLVGMHLLRS